VSGLASTGLGSQVKRWACIIPVMVASYVEFGWAVPARLRKPWGSDAWESELQQRDSRKGIVACDARRVSSFWAA